MMNKTSNSYFPEFILWSFAFLISPLFSILFYLSNLGSKRIPNKAQYYVFFTLLALWFAGMNATKIPDSDQIAYMDMYLSVPNYGFIEALTQLQATSEGSSVETYLEPVYKAFCYIGYYLTLGNPYLYFALVTFVIYMAMFNFIHRLLDYAGFGKLTIITGIVICGFFFQFFNETAHAIRQFLAGCIVLFAIIRKNETEKNQWWLYLLAILSHKSTLLFVILCLIPTKITRNKTHIIISIILLAVGTYFMSHISAAMMLLGFEDSYVLGRAVNDSQEFSEMNKIILYGVSLPILYVCLRSLLLDCEETRKISYFLYISMLLCVFVISCGKNTLFQGRYFFYLYSIVPFAIPLLFRKTNSVGVAYKYILCLFMPLYFFMSFETCIWHYADTFKLLFYPYPSLLFHF